MKNVHLNRLMRLEQCVPVMPEAGGYSESWQILGRLWVACAPQTGRNIGENEVILSAVTHKITLRAAPYGAPDRPKAGQRLCEGARIFTILAVHEQEGGKYLCCLAKEEGPL